MAEDSVLNDPRVVLGTPADAVPSRATIEVTKGPPSTLQSLPTDTGGGNGVVKAAFRPEPDANLGDRYTAERGQAIAQANSPDAWFDSLTAKEAPADSGSAGQGPNAASGTGAPSGAEPSTPPVSGAGGAAASGGGDKTTLLNPDTAWGRYLAPLASLVVHAPAVSDAVTGDVARGAIETPGAIVRGAAGATEQTFRAADDLANWLNAHVLDTTLVPGDANDPAKWLADRAAEVKSIFAERQSNTGKAVEFTAQWLTSRKLAGNLSKALGMPVNAYTKYVNDLVAGAIGFDPKAPRLSNVIDAAAPNALTDFLKAKDDDPELLGRLKAGLETAGLSVAADGILAGFKFLKEAFRSRPTAAPPTPSDASGSVPRAGALDAATAQELADRAPLKMVDVEGRVAKAASENAVPPPVVASANSNSEFADQAARFLKGEIPDVPVQVNLDRFDGPEQIQQAIADLAKLLPPAKTIPMETTLAQARELGLDIGPNAALDAKQIAAKWMMVHAAAARLPELGAKAAATGAPEDIARLNAAVQVAYGILRTAKDQSADIARALQIHNAIRKAQPDLVTALQKMIDETGGNAVSLDFAARIAAFKDPAEVAAFLEELPKASTRDKLAYAWSNILLSNPATHVANVGDTALATFAQVPETWFASKIGPNVAEGEATARLFGILSGWRDGLRLAARTLQTGQSRYSAAQRFEMNTNRPTAALVGSDDLMQSGPTRQFADWLKMLLPTRLMAAGDELTKTMNYRGEAAALAWRKAVIEQGLTGHEAARYAGRLMADMPEWLSEAAQAQAVKGTFNEPLTGAMASFARGVDAVNIPIPGTSIAIPIGRVLAPFVRTPTNLIRWSFQRTPLGFLSPSVQADLAAGGAARDAALARIATGSAIMATFADLTLSGRITGVGPKDPGLRADLMRTGWQPYSVYIPGKGYVSYNRSGTFGTLIGLAADATELLTGVYTRQRETVNIDGTPVEDSVAATITLPFVGAVMSRSWTSGLAGLVDALSDPLRNGESYIERTVASVVPSGIAAVERAVDPMIRRAQDSLEAIRARVPGLSESLPPRLDQWGQPIKDENGIWGIFVPARFSSEKGGAIDREISRMKLEVAPPRQVQDFGKGGVSLPIKLDPETHNQLIKLSGNELKLAVPGVAQPMGAHDYLDAIVDGKAGAISRRYAQGSDDVRELIIRDVLSKYRGAAKQALVGENGDLRALIGSSLESKANAMRAPRGAAPVLE